MTEKEKTAASRFISFVLRHHPEKIGITLDDNGWADTKALLKGMGGTKHKLTLDILKDIVANDDKKRYKFSNDYSKIRANQGHSVNVNVEMKRVTPPDVLYHGTTARFLPSIKSDGLLPQNRLHVHLSADGDTALSVGKRHGKPIVLAIDAAGMGGDGFVFLLSDNGVWLVDHVPVGYICNL